MNLRTSGVKRTVEILAALHRAGRPVAVGELAQSLGAPRSTIYALTKELVETGLLEMTGPQSTVFFGKTLYFYGLDFLREHDLLGRGRAEVDRLARETGETAQLCVLHARKYAVAHMSPGRRPFRISSEIGTQIPLPWTASGRLLLADKTPDEIRAIVTADDLVPPRGEPMTMDGFVAAVAAARDQGFCITSGVVDAYTHCIAAPLRDASGHVAATLCFVVVVETPAETVASLRDTLLASARDLSLAAMPIERRLRSVRTGTK